MEGHVSDYEVLGILMELLTPNPGALLADRKYDSNCFPEDLLIQGILPGIPSRKNRSVPPENRLEALHSLKPYRAPVQPTQANEPQRNPL
nr:hypothetical protein [Gluconobacter thailandicus]